MDFRLRTGPRCYRTTSSFDQVDPDVFLARTDARMQAACDGKVECALLVNVSAFVPGDPNHGEVGGPFYAKVIVVENETVLIVLLNDLEAVADGHADVDQCVIYGKARLSGGIPRFFP